MINNTTIVSSKIEKVWEATISPDDRKTQHYGYYDSYEKARESVAGKSWYGSDGRVSDTSKEALTVIFADGKALSFIIKDGFDIQRETAKDKEERIKRVREQALAKLTESERDALGL
ncbi:hypothetical protein EBPHNEJP_00160 [Salmonella phage CF-SP2]|nr:hypothetical protein EBPHNEJP_00160 [Salmonella phage CF-SP2]